MITAYAGYNFQPVVQGILRDIRVLWALEELSLPHGTHWMDVDKGEHRENPNRLVNPFGKIPSLEDGAQRMFESGAIVLYLYENAGRAPQDAHARAEVNQWCFAALNTVEPVFAEIFRWDIFWKDRPGREWRRPELEIAAEQRLTDLARALGDKPYLVGGNFGPADILMTSVLDFGRHAPELFAQHPSIRAYLERCHARPAYQRALAKQGTGPQANAA
jgi:glutathione S-transferase